jgi:hypothetical protein
MSGVSLPVTRPVGRALLVGSPASRIETLGVLERIGFASEEADDPYAAMAELCRRPLIYRALVLSLGSLYREELPLIAVVKRRFPHIEIWLTQTDGRAAALADGMRLGADGLVGEDGLHRIAVAGSAASTASPMHANDSVMTGETVLADAAEEAESAAEAERSLNEPVLTADELRALLQEQTYSPGDEPK